MNDNENTEPASHIFDELNKMSDAEKLQEWNRIKEKYKRSDKVHGIIIHKAPFGLFIDIKEKFPALLEIIQMRDLDYEKYKKDQIHRIGEEISAYFSFMPEKPDKILLSQKIEE